MRRPLILAAGLLLSAFTLAACTRAETAPAATRISAAQDPASGIADDGQRDPEVTSEMVSTTEGFAKATAATGLYELDASRIALERSKSPRVRSFAQQMIDAYTMTSDSLKSLLTMQKIDVPLPTGLDARRLEMIETLKSAPDGDFDARYLDQQASMHREAAMLFRGHAQHGLDPELKQFAAATLPRIERHLQMAQGLDRSDAGDKAIGGPLLAPRQ